MSARQDMAGLLQQWLQFTQAEGAAIESANWSAVQEIQARKAELKISLAASRSKWEREIPANDPARKSLRTELARLISLETRNAELLTAQMRRAREEQESLNQARRNLHKIQRSYVRRQATAFLTCYS